MTERTATEIAQAMRAAYMHDRETQFTLLPGDHKAIAAIELIAMWLKESGRAREAFNEWRKWKRDNPDG